MKEPTDEVKVLALKSGLRTKQHPNDYVPKDEAPGYNTAPEVRSAQAKLLACAIDDNEESLAGEVFVEEDPEVLAVIMDMITPNTAYVTGPPGLQSKTDPNGLYGFGERKSKPERDVYWKGLRGEEE